MIDRGRGIVLVFRQRDERGRLAAADLRTEGFSQKAAPTLRGPGLQQQVAAGYTAGTPAPVIAMDNRLGFFSAIRRSYPSSWLDDFYDALRFVSLVSSDSGAACHSVDSDEWFPDCEF